MSDLTSKPKPPPPHKGRPYALALIHEEIASGRQDRTLTRHLAFRVGADPASPSVPLRVAVKSDAYALHGWANVDRWDGSAWQNVYSMSPTLMESKGKGISGRPGQDDPLLEKDAQTALAHACAILAA